MNINETMLGNIYDSEKVLKKIFSQFLENNNYLLKKIQNLKLKKILILGTGSSINAVKASKYFLEEILDIKLYIEEPSVFFNYEKLDTEIDLLISVSQSGKSDSTIKGTLKVKKTLDIPVIVITANSSSPLSKYSELILDLNIGIEQVGFVTKGFSGTILNLYLLFLNLRKLKYPNDTGIVEKHLKDIELLINKIPDVINESNLYFEKNKDILINSNRFLCIGYGSNFGISKEFETKFTEVVRCPSSGFELEEYMHGPYLEANKEHVIFYLDNGDFLSERMYLLKKYMDKYIKFSTIISSEKDESNSIFINIGDNINKNLLVILFVIPIQILSYKIATNKGINVEKKIFSDFDLILKSKI